jgi:hypothetical protein
MSVADSLRAWPACLGRTPDPWLGDSRATSGPSRVGEGTSGRPPPRVGLPANPGPSSVPWSLVDPLPFPSCQPASTSRGSLLTRGSTHRGPSPPRHRGRPNRVSLPNPNRRSRALVRDPCREGNLAPVGALPAQARRVPQPFLCITAANQRLPAAGGVQNLVTLSRNWTGRFPPTRRHGLPGDPWRRHRPGASQTGTKNLAGLPRSSFHGVLGHERMGASWDLSRA